MQMKYSFDKETVTKIMKGALIAMTGAAALAGLNYLGTVQFTNPILVTFVAWAVPVAVNAVKEWMKGV